MHMIVLLNNPQQSCVVETLQIKCFNTKSKSLHSKLRLNPFFEKLQQGGTKHGRRQYACVSWIEVILD